MVNKKFLLIISAITLVFALTVVGCSGGSGGGGTFTLTDIPSEYNGKYALFAGGSLGGLGVGGWQSLNVKTSEATLPRISNGSVRIPVWKPDADKNNVVRYTGDDTLVFMVSISDSEKLSGISSTNYDPGSNKDIIGGVMFLSVAFSKGSAAKSWNEGVNFGNTIKQINDMLKF